MTHVPSNQSLSVSELNRKAKSLLELHLNQIWVEGEISNLSRPGSGHWYFSLKDDKAHVRCAMFRNRNLLVKTQVNSGDQVKVRGRVSLYEPRGDYQLIVDHMEPAGAGALQKQFEELKRKLAHEGLFAEESKQSLPGFVQKVAVISSPTGAALQDILRVLERRSPGIEVVVVPTVVQGEHAPAQLRSALQKAKTLKDIDVIIVGRGGGSLEDLWAFNDEQLARMIFDCPIPVVSAVGHEIDFSISDFVADVRAPTPSAAAELVSYEAENLLHALANMESRLTRAARSVLSSQQQSLRALRARIKHPGDRIHQWQQRTDFCEARLDKAVDKHLKAKGQRIALVAHSLKTQSPARKIPEKKMQLETLQRALHKNTALIVEKKRTALAEAANTLNIVSPLATLERGYTITKSDEGRVVHSVKDLERNQSVTLTMFDGEANADITSIRKR